MINATPTTKSNAKQLIIDGAHWEARGQEIVVLVERGALVVDAPFSAADQRRCACDVAERLIDACDAGVAEVLRSAIATSRAYAKVEALVERAMLMLARECGLRTPETRITKIGERDVLLVKRFDRENTKTGYRRGRMLSALTLLRAKSALTG